MKDRPALQEGFLKKTISVLLRKVLRFFLWILGGLAGLLAFSLFMIWIYSFLPMFQTLDCRIHDVYDLDPKLAYFHKPHSRNHYTDQFGLTEDAHINSLGFRGPEVENPKRHPRVFLIGDSVVFGQAVSDDETIAAQLQNQLAATNHPGEVINAGVKGYSTDQEFQLLRERIRPLQPDWVIWLICHDDFREVNTSAQILFDYDFANDRLVDRDVEHSVFYRSSEVFLWAKRSWNVRALRFFFNIVNQVTGLRETSVRRRELKPKFTKFVKESVEMAKDDHFKIAFFLLPNKMEISLARAQDLSPIPLIDLLHDPTLRAHWDRIFQHDGTHFTVFGSKLMAEVIAGHMQAIEASPTGK